jgi:hypothetical protein
MPTNPYALIVDVELSRKSTPKGLLTDAEMLEVQKKALGIRGANPFKDAWEFMSAAVWTRDEASKRIRRFADNDGWPEERFDYLKYLTYERPKERINAYEKSRRMLITWWLIAIYLFEMMTETNDLSALASDKLAKSAYLLGAERMQFMYDHIPPVAPHIVEAMRVQKMDIGPFIEEVWPNKPLVLFEGKQGVGWEQARCEAMNSRCMAVASGTSQMQQYTFSKVLMDEFSRWEAAQDCWRNIQPTLQGGGRADIVCTAELGSFAYDLLYDIEIG